MQIKRPLAPAFINRLDEYLLLNKPETWSARTHMVLYYGILFMAGIAAISFIVPDDPRAESPSAFWIGFVSLVSLVSLVGWHIYLLRFNVFKRYGLTSPLNRLVTFLLYFVSIGVFVLFCYVEPVVETVRANAAYTDEELVKDVNTVNVGIARLEYKVMDHRWARDTVLITKRAMDYESVRYNADGSMALEMVDPARLNERLANEDSVKKVNDSVYVVFQCPDYTPLEVYKAGNARSERLTAVDIYRKYIVNYKPPANRKQIEDELRAIRNKYELKTGFNRSFDDNLPVWEQVKLKYGVPYIYTSVYHILNRKHRWDGEGIEIAGRVFFYTTLLLTILVFTFRHTTAKTFFLSILTCIILFVLTALLLAFSGGGEMGIYNSIIFYFIASIGISVTAFFARKRSAFTGIAINIFFWMLPFMPLCLVARHYAVLREEYGYGNYNDSMQGTHLFMAEVIGILLLLIMVGAYFHQAYRKWYAAPEN